MKRYIRNFDSSCPDGSVGHPICDTCILGPQKYVGLSLAFLDVLCVLCGEGF
jgi:hypothetical protein